MVDFLIFYEHINREIENDTLVKYELEKRGYSCEIIQFMGPGLYKYSKRKNKAKVVVTPWLRYNSNVYKYIQFAKKPYKLVNLQWEQVYNKRGIACGLVATHGEAKKAYHTCWGENSRARLEDMGVPKGNLKIVGAMQQDYGRPIFKNYYLPREEIAKQFNLSNEKPWILFVSSFAYATFPESALKAMAEKYGDAIFETARQHRESQALFLDWVEEYLKRCDNEFIYRPHPSERLAARLSELESKYPNFHVISDYSVKQWAKVSDRVNLWISTSNAEIVSLGIDYSIVRPLPVDEDREVESMRDEVFVTDMEEFIRLNTENLSNSEKNARIKLDKLSHFYDYDESKPAYVRMADYLEEVYKTTNPLPFRFTLKEKIRFKIDHIKSRVASRIIEKQLNKKEGYIESLPIKKSAKEHYIKGYKNYKIKKQTEERMMEYLKSHE